MRLSSRPATAPLYTAEERARRDASGWTLVQGIRSPLQFLGFLISVALVLRTLGSGEGAALASASVLLKTLVLYTIMVTGALWEKDVFGQYLFARPFFWEDVVSMGVIALHTLYVVMLFADIGGTALQLQIALAAYLIYVVNAAQFVNKLRLARLAAAVSPVPSENGPGGNDHAGDATLGRGLA